MVRGSIVDPANGFTHTFPFTQCAGKHDKRVYHTPLNQNKVLERFKTVLKKASLPDIRFHDLRHSAATMLLAMGVHPDEIVSRSYEG